MAVQLTPCGVLLPGPVQYCSQHSCIIAVELLLQLFSQHPSSASIQQYRHDRSLEETALWWVFLGSEIHIAYRMKIISYKIKCIFIIIIHFGCIIKSFYSKKCILSVSSSSSAASMDFPDSLSLSIPIIHCSWLVFQTISCVCTELMFKNSCWLANIGTSMCRDPLKNITYEFIQQCPIYFVFFPWMSFEMGGKWPYSCCFMGCLVWFRLVCWVLWHINLCRLFNAKSIFM